MGRCPQSCRQQALNQHPKGALGWGAESPPCPRAAPLPPGGSPLTLTPAAVSAETVASIAAALVAPRAVGANLLAARGVGTVVNVCGAQSTSPAGTRACLDARPSTAHHACTPAHSHTHLHTSHACIHHTHLHMTSHTPAHITHTCTYHTRAHTATHITHTCTHHIPARDITHTATHAYTLHHTHLHTATHTCTHYPPAHITHPHMTSHTPAHSPMSTCTQPHTYTQPHAHLHKITCTPAQVAGTRTQSQAPRLSSWSHTHRNTQDTGPGPRTPCLLWGQTGGGRGVVLEVGLPVQRGPSHATACGHLTNWLSRAGGGRGEAGARRGPGAASQQPPRPTPPSSQGRESRTGGDRRELPH